MPPAEFEPAIPASERSQTLALHRSAELDVVFWNVWMSGRRQAPNDVSWYRGCDLNP